MLFVCFMFDIQGDVLPWSRRTSNQIQVLSWGTFGDFNVNKYVFLSTDEICDDAQVWCSYLNTEK